MTRRENKASLKNILKKISKRGSFNSIKVVATMVQAGTKNTHKTIKNNYFPSQISI